MLVLNPLTHEQGSSIEVSKNQGWCRIRVINSTDSILTISTTCDLLPGVVLTFDSSYFLIFQRLDDSLYIAKYYTLIRSVVHKKTPQIGAELLLRAPNYSLQKEYRYWLDVQNNYLSSKYGADGRWLSLENSSSKGSNTVRVGDPIMLAIKNPPIEGYLCVLGIDSSRSTVVFPNSLDGTQNHRKVTYRGIINLTYHRENGLYPAFINAFFKAQQPGNLCFVAIICTKPKALVDFLPKGDSSLYQGLEGNELKPWAIGPGFYEPNAPFRSTRGIEYNAGDSWAFAILNIKII